MNRCLRSDGSERGWWETQEEAIAYRDSHSAYFGDRVIFCQRCGAFHCTNPNWPGERPWETPVELLRPH